MEPRRLLDGDLVISEVMYHAASGNPNDDWIEIHNRGLDVTSLEGYRFSNGVDYTFGAETLEPGGYLVVAADLARFQNNYPSVTNVVGNWTGSLSNRGENLAIEDATGSVVDETFYADSGDYAVRRLVPDDRSNPNIFGWEYVAPHDGEGATLEVVNSAFSNDYAHNWAPSATLGGTPGAANSVAMNDIAPAVFDVAHAPIIPTSSDDVTITARIIDDGTEPIFASLYWRVSELNPGDFAEIPLTDDGLSGDGAASDGLFVATIPAQPHNTIIEFYLHVADAGGMTRTYPAPSDDAGDQEANLLYQVDDVEHPADIPLYRTIMTVAEQRDFNSFQRRETDAEANVTLISNVGGDIEFRYNVGVRYRGSSSRGNNPPNTRINIPSDRPWLGNTEVNINAVAPQNQIAGSALWALAGEPASDAWAVRMLQNNGDLGGGGFFAQVEVQNSDWAQRHFPLDSEGNAYKGRRADESPPGGQGAGLEYFGQNPSRYVSYLKTTNGSEADYSDVIRLTDVLNNTPDATYVEEVEQVIDIDQWFRAIALTEATGYSEFGLLTGDQQGDDYAMYRGIEDPHFLMIPYDLDSMFDQVNGNMFSFEGVFALNRLASFPELTPRLYAQFLDVTEVLTADNVRPHLVQMLGAVIPEASIDGMVAYLQNRADFIRSQIPQELTVESLLGTTDGIPRSIDGTSGLLRGQSHAVLTRSVLVNGHEASWNGRDSEWFVNGLSLDPGMNRIVVQSMDDNGMEFARTTIDIWYDDGNSISVTGSLAESTTWTAAEGPYIVSGDFLVPAGMTLMIEPGTTVLFSQGSRMVVRGELQAIGDASRPIRFTRAPGAVGTWNGLQFRDATASNRIHHAIIEWGVTDDGMIGLENSRLELDHVTLDHTDRRRIRTIDSSLVVRNSTFANIFDPGVAPTTDNLSEHIWGRGIPADGEFLIENNVFGTITGHNDGIDFDAPTLPGPIPRIIGNQFLGGGDDALDMTGDVYIEGNTFRNYIKDEFNLDPGQSNVISSSSGTYYVIRNIFENIEHAALIKEGAFMYFLNNTVTNAATSALYFDLPGQTSGPGRGAVVSGSILDGTPVGIDVSNPPTDSLAVTHSLLPARELGLGIENVAGDALFQDVAAGDFSLQNGSPAQGTGPNGADMGAIVSAGATVAGEPDARTRSAVATLTIGGPGIVSYRYRINDGALSAEIPVDTPVTLNGLADGNYQLEVIGINVLSQEQPSTFSKSWNVDPTLAGLVINEVLASNDAALAHGGIYPDVIELYNRGDGVVDLTGMSITDDPAVPDAFVFPNGTTLGPDEYLILYADDNRATTGIHLGFNLNGEGEGVYLFDTVASGQALIDSVEYGLQITDLSIGRDRHDAWTLTRPTLGQANDPLTLGTPDTLKINEWFAANEVVFDQDFIELYNPNPAPVWLGGLYITDNALGDPARHQIAPLSFIAGQGVTYFVADGDELDGPNHVDFTLSPRTEVIGLFDAELNRIDMIRYAPQQNDVSEGRTPNGAVEIARFLLPNPGLDNPSEITSHEVDLLAIDDVWSYDDTGVDRGTAWREPAFDDSGWTSGPGLLYFENEPLPAPKGTQIELGHIAYYFRRNLTIEDLSHLESVQFTSVIDDGAVFYVNGVEVLRLRMPNGGIEFDTLASNPSVGEANYEGPFEIPLDLLHDGNNVLAVEVHQQATNSSDIVFGMTVSATTTPDTGTLTNNELLMGHLRITELMYNPIGGADLEYIELRNTGTEPVDLAGVRLTSGVDFTFPALTLDGGDHVLVVNDLAAFEGHYGTGLFVAGEYDGNLSNGGETIRLQLPAPQPANILWFTYDDAWYPTTDGAGFSLVIVDAEASRERWTVAEGWRPSNFIGGSPGVDDAGLDAEVIVVNEVLANTGGAEGGQVELKNNSLGLLVMDGWYLSDDASDLTKYQLPAGTSLVAGGYLVITEQADFGADFALSPNGGHVYLASPDAIGGLAGYIASMTYGAADSEFSIGRHEKSDGSFDVTIMSVATLGSENASPLVGPIVINELMYRPINGGDEFIELHNITDAPVSLYDPAVPVNTWQLAGGVEFDFPTGIQIAPGGYALVVGVDPEAFRVTYDIPAEVTILGPYTGDLADGGDELFLFRPGAPAGPNVPAI
ncbi:MAG: lamin tail domain-containing protein, partial [Planctomycetales bacterium]|nr:lamin tail domain-containing protein [Planctomycetales bacterium]